MKTTASLLILTLTALHSFGGTGPGPWSQGAYYPEQLDGKYAASVSKDPTDLNPTPVGGVIGFGLQSGAPTYLPSATGATTTPVIDPRANYYAIFVGGVVFTGTTIGFLDIDKKRVSGALVPPAGVVAQGGGFAGKIKSSQAIFTFKGNGSIGGTAYRLSGIKTSNTP
jgi:hypothetical protein